MRTINLPPKPASLIESMRDIGYSIETAVADMLITALQHVQTALMFVSPGIIVNPG